MTSLYLSRLKLGKRQALIAKLHSMQHGNSFICEQAIDLEIHKDYLDVDHVVPLNGRGKDDPVNFALTHASCNRSKQASNLEVARVLHHFKQLKDKLANEYRSPNLGDLLQNARGDNYKLGSKLSENKIT